jgi:hypothetical protein
MSRQCPTTLPIPKFFGKYWKPIEEALAREEKSITMESLVKGEHGRVRFITDGMLWDELREWWPVQLLRAAAKENDREGYKRVLSYFLLKVVARPPQGVLTPFRWKRGRPEETESVYHAWIAMGRPSLNWRILDELAKLYYADHFARARSDAKLRKNLRDRIGETIRRHERARKSQPIS